MDVINAYLETMFSPYPQTPRLLEAKEELRGMMEDAYNEAASSGRSHNEAVGQVILHLHPRVIAHILEQDRRHEMQAQTD